MNMFLMNVSLRYRDSLRHSAVSDRRETDISRRLRLHTQQGEAVALHLEQLLQVHGETEDRR